MKTPYGLILLAALVASVLAVCSLSTLSPHMKAPGFALTNIL